jgi:hypothetical protein
MVRVLRESALPETSLLVEEFVRGDPPVAAGVFPPVLAALPCMLVPRLTDFGSGGGLRDR